MSLWSRFLDLLGPPISPPASRCAPPPLLAPTIPPALQGDGAFSLSVVGEAQYQNALNRICGGRTRDGHNLQTLANLVLEDTNPHDPKAVQVAIQGLTVGYLTRDKARRYRERIADLGQPSGEITCRALITGGWNRGGGDVGHYGVRLDVDLRKQAGGGT